MLTQSPSLSDQFAHLRIASQAQETCAWLPSAVHAIIMACLARIFGRLEQLLLLWQSGDLPLANAPPLTPASLDRPDAARSAPYRAGHAQRARDRRGREAGASASPAQRHKTVFPTPSRVMTSAPRCAALRARAARDPPCRARPVRQKPRIGGSPTRGLIITK